MTWLKVDDSFAEHPKVAALSDAAFRAHVTAMCYSARLLTDGRVPEAVARGFRSKVVKELVSAGVWTPEPTTGYLIHDYLDWNPSRQQILDKRRKESERKKGGNPDGNPRGIPLVPDEDSSGPVPDPSLVPEPELQKTPTAYANGNPNQPTPDQQYLLRRLFEMDSNWSEVTLPALVQLNQAWGTDVVRSALGRLREAPPDHVAKPYGLLAAVCAEIAKESA